MKLDITQDEDKAHQFDYETATKIVEQFNSTHHNNSLQKEFVDNSELFTINFYDSEYDLIGFLASNQLAS